MIMPAEMSPDLLAQHLGAVLEEAAFVFAEASEDAPPFGDDVIEARLAFSGALECELVLASEATFAATLAANLLGEEEGGASVTGDDEDAVGELLNMIAGAVAAELCGPEERCVLGLPRVRRLAAEEYASALEGADAVATMVEEEGRRIDLSASVGGGRPR
jgi:hypothetical protein